MDKILKIVKKYNLKLIEDCAHSIETTYKVHTGNFISGCFSFYANKNITTAGEGGMILCKSKKMINISKNYDYTECLKKHGKVRY